eukprot:5396995-Pleurochrysis_carterae.AAC.2
MAAVGPDGGATEHGARETNSVDQDTRMPDFRPPYVIAVPISRPGVVIARPATALPADAGTDRNEYVLA